MRISAVIVKSNRMNSTATAMQSANINSSLAGNGGLETTVTGPTTTTITTSSGESISNSPTAEVITAMTEQAGNTSTTAVLSMILTDHINHSKLIPVFFDR